MTRPDTDPPGRLHRSPTLFRLVAGVLVAVLVLAGCGDDDSGAAADSDPAAVLADYQEAVNAHDIDAVVALFATDAVIIGHPLSGNDIEGSVAIRAIQAEVLTFSATENAYEYVDIAVTGNTVTFGGTFTNNEGECFSGAGHNVEVKDGKIVRWEVGASSQPCN